MPKFHKRCVSLTFVGILLGCLAESIGFSKPLVLHAQRLERPAAGGERWKKVEQKVDWEPSHTAAVICDMWDAHWCKGATTRVAEMAPRMNKLVEELRKAGVLIIHCPSDTMKFYEGTAARKLAQAAPKVESRVPLQRWCGLDREKEEALPIDDSDGGCDDEPRCKEGSPWRCQIATIEIQPGDAVTDSAEAYYLMKQRGLTNVLVMGVHQNMCVLGRPFSIRQMVKQGQNVLLVRDLTDSMYNSRSKPFVDHFTGNELVRQHIEKYWCATVSSDQVLGGRPFRFSGDTTASK
jgi:nicotinamidase-related amidase